MLLKSLDIQGFKSFPDKTKITFGKGLTAVVGPNGSGKSNISDAVRWVMGEQSTKTLRGSKMEDVIFTGTKTRKSQGFAEVSLTVDNKNREFMIDSDDITITRRYNRSGDSEYMINNNIVRLKDLQETLMDTGLGKDGYSMIGQGRISEIVQSKSNERREIFEEAAGISKFRHRKKEAERNLERAEDNLLRLRDILSELELRVGPLKEQSQKAKKFIELSEQKKSLEVSLWIDTIERSNQALKDESDRILVYSNKHDGFVKEIEDIENKIQQAFTDMQNSLVSIDNMRHQKSETESDISDLTSKIAVCNNNIEHNKQNILRIKSEIENNSKNIDSVNLDIEAKHNQILDLKQKLSELNELISNKQSDLLIKSTETNEFTQREKELSDELNVLLLEQSKTKIELENATANVDELKEVIKKNEIEEQNKNNEIQKLSKELDDENNFMTDLQEKSESLKNTYAGHKIKLDNKKDKLSIIKSECDTLSLKIKEKEQKKKLLEAMEQSLDGFKYSVKEVIKKSKNNVLTGIYGTVSQLIDVNSEYSTAIETALGGAMQNIIVKSENDAKACMRALKNEKLGRATFLPLSSISGAKIKYTGFEDYAGFIDIASNLVSYDSKFEGVISSLLSKIVVVDDIDTAIIIAKKYKYKFKIVTLDGQIVNAGGSFTGGSKNKGQSFLSRKNDIIKLKKDIDNLNSKLEKNNILLSEINEEVSKIEAEFTAVASEMTTLNEDKIRVEGECKRIEQLLLNAKNTLKDMSNELNSKHLKLENAKNTIIKDNEKLDMMGEQINTKTTELNSLRVKSQSIINLKTALSDEISEINIQRIGYEKDIEVLNQSIIELEHVKENTDIQYNHLYKQIKSFENQNNDILIDIENKNKDISNKRNLIEELNSNIDKTIKSRQEYEAKTTNLRKDERYITEQKEKIASEMARLKEKKNQIQKDYDGIIAKLWNEYELTKSEAQAISIEIENTHKANSELNSLRSKIRSLGNVNVSAIEEYKEVSQRYEFLNNQVSDAQMSKSELIKLISELTKKMENIFAENFDKINENFKKIFVDLFEGGRANLALTDPDNLLESGIEIFVEPPGKIIKNLASLSGGEQSFVAIAIYFAILKVRPAPFCILDEIEAALDDVNVDKYASYLRSMSDKTQFIMITHRRGSMEVADILYGITMQDEGVSKLLKLDVSEIENNLSLKA